MELLTALAAEPRPTGGAAIQAARACCASELTSLGFTTRERPFEFSEFPGRFATPLLGGAGAFVVGAAGHYGAQGMRYFPLVIASLGALTLYSAGVWLAMRGVTVAPVMRRQGVNLEATRPGETPRVWLCAHLDSKSQPIPSLVRSAGVILESIGFLATLCLAIGAALGLFAHELLWMAAALMTLVGALPVVSSVVGSRSPGALDNAAGVVAVLAAARRLSDVRGVGVLITDAEELGMAGARAWSAGREVTTVLNCDGVDDAGETHAMFTGKRPTELLQAVKRASEAEKVAVRQGRLALGILADSVAFTDAGLKAITFSRGSLRSLRRVHSRKDDLAHLRGEGVEPVAAVMAATARTLLTSEA